MMKVPYTKSGKCGDTVWQWNGHRQTSYPYRIPHDPRTPAQVQRRKRFGAVSARWRGLTEAQRRTWCATAKSQRSRRRLGQAWPLNGFLFFMRVNLCRANQGLAPAELPPAPPPPARAAAARPPECLNPAGASVSFSFPVAGVAEAGADRDSAWSFTCFPGSPVWLYGEQLAALRPELGNTG